MPPLDHLPAFITACRSTFLKSCNEVDTGQTSWALTFLGYSCYPEGWHNGGVVPTRDRGRTELLPHIVIVEGNKLTASTLP